MSLRAALLGFLAALITVGANAQGVDDFYKDKTVAISVGYLPGGGYDLHARALARFIGGHIPGKPNMVVKNVPGGAGLTSRPSTPDCKTS